MNSVEIEIIKALDNGLDSRNPFPFQSLSTKAGCTEQEFLIGVNNLVKNEKIKRFGIVLKNRTLGLIHNAMVVLDIPNHLVDAIGEKISKYDFVKLCYQRERIVPEWNYNLYFMIHGKNRDVVNQQILMILNDLDLLENKKEILFSTKCLKQKGASYY